MKRRRITLQPAEVHSKVREALWGVSLNGAIAMAINA